MLRSACADQLSVQHAGSWGIQVLHAECSAPHSRATPDIVPKASVQVGLIGPLRHIRRSAVTSGGILWSFASSRAQATFIVLGQPASERSLVTRAHLSTKTSSTLHKASPRVISRGSRSSRNMALLMDIDSFLIGTTAHAVRVLTRG
jgi:hypothetical protein